MILYVVTMYRYGNRESHSYVLGMFNTRIQAIKEAKAEREYRGGKYEGEVLAFFLNESTVGGVLIYQTADLESIQVELMKSLCSRDTL